MEYYKLVRERDGDYCSAIVNGNACLPYVMGKRTYGYEGTPVLVFRRASAARHYRSIWSDRDILVGKAGKPREQSRVSIVGLTSRFLTFWKRGGEDQSSWTSQEAPAGTYAAEWFEPQKVLGR